MRQMFVVRVKEKESELKDAEKEVKETINFFIIMQIYKINHKGSYK